MGSEWGVQTAEEDLQAAGLTPPPWGPGRPGLALGAASPPPPSLGSVVLAEGTSLAPRQAAQAQRGGGW